MSFLSWMAVAGAVLLVIALSSAYVRHMPVSTSALYLGLGLLLGPAGLGLLRIDLIEESSVLEHLTEIAVIVSLFVGGLKLRLPFSDGAWSAAYRLAGPVMLASICGVAALLHLAFGIPLPVSFLIGAVLAPTDPVLASTVSVSDAADNDRMRYGLSGEAGFNDGAAFPFVVFSLMWIEASDLGGWVGWWALHRIVWAVPAGLLFGFFLGKYIGRLSIWLRSRHRETEAPNDFLAMALIALAYVGAEAAGAWGFLSVFAAGLGFRRAEVKVVRENPVVPPKPEPSVPEKHDEHAPAEEAIRSQIREEDLEHPATASGVVISDIISFGDTVERLMEILLVVTVGICVALYWDWRALPVALFLFVLLRPAAVMTMLAGTPTGRYQRLLMAWFGIRGIGSLYYLTYAINHGLVAGREDAAGITLSVVALSVLVHGMTSQPILAVYERYIAVRK
jgi:sodium/hydrogen antiporter